MWPTLERYVLEDGGYLPIGETGPVPCAAIANDGSTMHVALQRRPCETLSQLLTRLDQALVRALDEDKFTDEING